MYTGKTHTQLPRHFLLYRLLPGYCLILLFGDGGCGGGGNHPDVDDDGNGGCGDGGDVSVALHCLFGSFLFTLDSIFALLPHKRARYICCLCVLLHIFFIVGKKERSNNNNSTEDTKPHQKTNVVNIRAWFCNK